ncbi:MAG TPA: hypothetical protein PLO37_01205 [Candidatus Hydrogenedentes bacterium]|nr:hypothetical protein [Candidatus Hydrogenedentota bacterium]HPG65433.1 hypothetical protein [Candidatus Hydrogenedentota bacterium]
MVTIILSALGVALVVAIWGTVDVLARKQLGNRHHRCGKDSGSPCERCSSTGQCEMHPNTSTEDKTDAPWSH